MDSLPNLQAAASGQPGITFHPEVTDPKDRAKADVRCFIHNNEAEAIEAKSRESSAKAADPEGIDSNRAAFGKVSPQDPGSWSHIQSHADQHAWLEVI